MKKDRVCVYVIFKYENDEADRKEANVGKNFPLNNLYMNELISTEIYFVSRGESCAYCTQHHFRQNYQPNRMNMSTFPFAIIPICNLHAQFEFYGSK